jgi:hypothetical protein
VLSSRSGETTPGHQPFFLTPSVRVQLEALPNNISTTMALVPLAIVSRMC